MSPPNEDMHNARVPYAQHYHQRTKYDPATLRSKSQPLNFAQQPSPFKIYRLGHEIDLKPYLEAADPKDPWFRLSRLLINSYGLTAKLMPAGGKPFYLRAAPSAGGLYPAEVYLVARGSSHLSAGIYNYQVRTHSLWRYWDDYLWSGLQEACFWHPALEATQLALVVTVVFYRSAWRYQDRAYRRVCLDSGHLLGNISLAGTLTDYRPHLIAGFADESLNRLLYLESDQESAIAVLPLADLLAVEQNLPRFRPALPSPVHTDYPTASEGALLIDFHHATELALDQNVGWQTRSNTEPQTQAAKYDFPFCLKATAKSQPVSWGDQLQGLEESLLRRRSTRSFSGAGLSRSELNALLDFTYQPHHYRNQGFDAGPDYCDLSLLETFVVISAVEGLEEGCYYYAPESEELRQVRFKNFRSELHYLCLGQHLGRDAAAVVFHTADLSAGITKYGDRVYRYLHLDAGHLGQRLNLAATRLGIGVSGIAGFFDDQVNEVLGIPVDQAVVYITTLGRPEQESS